MRRAIDANVLVYAHIPALEFHDAVHAFLLAELASPERTLVVTPLVLHEFVHVVTDPRRFDPPVMMSEAMTIARGYLGRSNVECLEIGMGAILHAFDLLRDHRLGRKRIADTLLAATLIGNNIGEIATCNAHDFEIFEGLQVIDPLI